MADKASTAVKDANLSLLSGAMNLTVDILHTVRTDGKTPSFPLICPDEDPPLKPKQFYVHPDDEDGIGPTLVNGTTPVRMWTVSECDHAREVDGILHRVTAEEMAATKEPVLPVKMIDITIFPAEQVEAQSRPSGALFRVRPKNSPHIYSMIARAVEQADNKAFIGEMTVRGVQRMYRLITWQGVLMLQEWIRPGEFHAAEDYEHDFPTKLLDSFLNAADTLTEEFDPVAYANFLRDRAAELDDSKRDPNAPKVAPARPVPVAKDDADSLTSMLESLAAAKKPAKKK